MSGFGLNDNLDQALKEFEKNHPGGIEELKEFGKKTPGNPNIESFDELFQSAVNSHRAAIDLILRLDSELRCVCLHVKILEAALAARNEEGNENVDKF